MTAIIVLMFIISLGMYGYLMRAALKFKNKVINENVFPIIDKSSWFYKNCKRQRSRESKICQVCPFREDIEKQENDNR